MSVIKVEQHGLEFPEAKFKDFYDKDCYIKLSSIVEPRCIWLGSWQGPMHLNLDQVAQLMPILQRFVDTGDINEKSGLTSFE